jgi:hypothetical protein
MQYLLGLHEFTTMPPFSQSSITNFRKYTSLEMINAINDDLFRKTPTSAEEEPPAPSNKKDNDGDENQDGGMPSEPDADDASTNLRNPSSESVKNKGTLMLDATCAPADIRYPTDLNLLNEARKKLEGMIDTLYPHTAILKNKPRTYREIARKDYLAYQLGGKAEPVKLREAIEQQLKYVKRNLKHIDGLLQLVSADTLSTPQKEWLETIRLLYEQQLYMYENDVRSVENRIVNISQPHVRPIKRGKANAAYEFGAKVSISLVDGYAFVDTLGWDSYNESAQLIPAIEAYKQHYGFYPERVLADQIYRNKDNRAYCKEHGIRLSGPPLGRPRKTEAKAEKKQAAIDSADRNAVESKFGEGKNKYGLGRIMARIKESCETVIALAFLSMNINRRLRTSLSFLRILELKRNYMDYFPIFAHFACG